MIRVIKNELKNLHYMGMNPILYYQRKQNFPGTKNSQLVQMVNSSLTQFGFIQNDQGVAQNANSVVNYGNF